MKSNSWEFELSRKDKAQNIVRLDEGEEEESEVTQEA